MMHGRAIWRWAFAAGVWFGVLTSSQWSRAAAQEAPLDQRISVDFAGTPLKDVLHFLSDKTGINFAFADQTIEEAPSITAKMRDVPVRSILQAFAMAAGLECQFLEDNVVVLRKRPTGPGAKPPAPPREGPLCVYTFEEGIEGWFAPRARFKNIDIDGHVGRTERAENVKNGKASLEWQYAYGPNRVSSILRRMRFDAAVSEIGFWLNSQNAPISILVQLKEQDGSQYQADVRVDSAGAWTFRQLSPDEFHLGEDSEDENDVLDLDQVQEISFTDITGILMQTEGENTVWIDDVTVK